MSIIDIVGKADGTVMIVVVAVLVVLFFILLKSSLKLVFKLLINAVVGFFILFVFNFVGRIVGVTIAVNWVTAIIAGLLGLPGIALRRDLQWMSILCPRKNSGGSTETSFRRFSVFRPS